MCSIIALGAIIVYFGGAYFKFWNAPFVNPKTKD